METAGRRILIIEDEAPMQKALSDALSSLGFTTLQSRDGEEGIQVALKEHPSLILLDILMPKMDGMSMMKRLRDDAWGKTVPVIILTNVSPDADSTMEAIVQHQPAYYLVKSDTKIEGVLEKVKEILKLE